MGAYVDGEDSRRHFAEKIIALSGRLPKPDRFRNYLMQRPATELADRLRVMVFDSSRPTVSAPKVISKLVMIRV